MYHRLSGIFYCLVLLFLLSHTDAQSQPYYFRHYQVENGLSNNSVYFIRQDSKGFIWIATKDGLNRFDGVGFKVFRIDSAHNEKHLSTDYIYCIQPGEHGWLWVGSQRGLYQYNPEKERLEPFIDSLKNIYDITIDRKGQMWFISSLLYAVIIFKQNDYNSILPQHIFWPHRYAWQKMEQYGSEHKMGF